MLLTIPIEPNVPHQRFRTALEGVAYTFDVRWNARASAWYFDLYDGDEDLIVASVRLVLGEVLSRRVPDSRMWNGILVLRDTTNQGVEPTLEDFGDRVRLLYLESE